MNYLQPVIAVLIAQCAGFLGAIFTTTKIGSWYMTLVKPTWNPPGWIFGPVWTTLYALMGIASYLVWKTPVGSLRTQALVLYGIQLALNALWSFAFFGMESPKLGLGVIVVLLVFIILTTARFSMLSKTAGYLMLPYILWVSFATVLNFTIVRLNP
jgi:tryptophan-rich sensory protein